MQNESNKCIDWFPKSVAFVAKKNGNKFELFAKTQLAKLLG